MRGMETGMLLSDTVRRYTRSLRRTGVLLLLLYDAVQVFRCGHVIRSIGSEIGHII